MFDDDEWIRSLTDAEAITADILERQVTSVAQGDTSQNQGVDPQEGATRADGRLCSKVRVQAALGAQQGRRR